MNKLREQFRERLLGQLSQEKTEVDINNAVDVCKDFSVSFSLFARKIIVLNFGILKIIKNGSVLKQVKI